MAKQNLKKATNKLRIQSKMSKRRTKKEEDYDVQAAEYEDLQSYRTMSMEIQKEDDYGGFSPYYK